MHESSDCASNTSVLIHQCVSMSGMSIHHNPFDMTFIWKIVGWFSMLFLAYAKQTTFPLFSTIKPLICNTTDSIFCIFNQMFPLFSITLLNLSVLWLTVGFMLKCSWHVARYLLYFLGMNLITSWNNQGLI